MRTINGRIPVLMSFSHKELREMAEKAWCVLRHDDATGMLAFIPKGECRMSDADIAKYRQLMRRAK
jgi:hypothetical protein